MISISVAVRCYKFTISNLQIKKKKKSRNAVFTVSLPQCPALLRTELEVIKCFISIPSKHLNSAL